ncbi:MAG: CPBP family intramembrane glutamic endopeptidase [Brevinematia bacterium]
MNKKVVIFLVVSFLFSWIIALVIWKFSLYEGRNLLLTTLLVVYMFGPAIGAIIAQRSSNQKVKDLGIEFKVNKWWILGVLSILTITILTPLISYLLGGGLITSWEELQNKVVEIYKSELAQKQMEKIGKVVNNNILIFYLITILSGVAAGLTINGLAAFGEELGWRGLLFEEFKKYGFIKSSFLIGIIWGLWHAPIIAMGHNFPQHPTEGIFLMTAFCVALAFIMNYFRLKSNSVILSSIMHGTLNGTAGIYVYANKVSNDILYNLAGIAGIMVIILLIFIISFDREVFLSEKLN